MAMRKLTRLFQKSTTPGVDIESVQFLDLGNSSMEKMKVIDHEDDETVNPKNSNDEDTPKMKKITGKVMLIKEHKVCAGKLETLKGQIASYRSILQQMSDVYSSVSDQCPCSRYTTLEKIVAEAIKEYDHVHSTTSEERDQETTRLLGPMERLKDDTGKFFHNEHALMAQSVYYAEASESNLKKELEVYRLELKRMTEDHELEMGRLESLKRGYEKIKDYCCFRRYHVLKHLVEDAIVNCLVEIN